MFFENVEVIVKSLFKKSKQTPSCLQTFIHQKLVPGAAATAWVALQNINLHNKKDARDAKGQGQQWRRRRSR